MLRSSEAWRGRAAKIYWAVTTLMALPFVGMNAVAAVQSRSNERLAFGAMTPLGFGLLFFLVRGLWRRDDPLQFSARTTWTGAGLCLLWFSFWLWSGGTLYGLWLSTLSSVILIGAGILSERTERSMLRA
jgi:hypothetical protein